MASSSGGKVFDAVSLAGTNTYYSHVSVIENMGWITYVYKFVRSSGTLAGTLTVEVCNASSAQYNAALALDGGAAGGANVNALMWDTYDPPGFSITAINTSGTQTDNIELQAMGYALVRLKYVNATGTGTVTAQFAGKAA
jgi:hypothetical protein